jgi:anaphase-promoting complex subunit 11
MTTTFWTQQSVTAPFKQRFLSSTTFLLLLPYQTGDDVCGICRMPFDGCPPEGKFPGDDSPVVWGICSHSFHLQCINRWLSTQAEQKCPFCRRAWEFKQADVATTSDPEGEQGGDQ